MVKNAAGFDLSKFLVGSLGQYAIMTELTFKVFPDVPRFRSLRLDFPSLSAWKMLQAASISAIRSVYELDALDLLPAAARLVPSGAPGRLPRRRSRSRVGAFRRCQ